MSFANIAEHSFLALIGDLAGSRRLPDRADTQRRLEEALAALNERQAGGSPAARFVITAGDEFQGLLRRPEAVLDALLFLEEREPAVRIRYGIGWGSLATPLRPDALGMDGPCFYLAREALMTGKRDDRWVTARGFGAAEDAVLDALFSLLGALRAGWTRTQARTVALARAAEREGRTRRSVADGLGVSPSVVSEALKAARWEAAREGEAALRRALALFAGAPA